MNNYYLIQTFENGQETVLWFKATCDYNARIRGAKEMSKFYVSGELRRLDYYPDHNETPLIMKYNRQED